MATYADLIAELPSVIVDGVTPGHIEHSIIYKEAFEAISGLGRIVVDGDGIDYTGATGSTGALQDIVDDASTFATTLGSRTRVAVHLSPGILEITGLILPAQVELVGHRTQLAAGGSGPMIQATGRYWGIYDLDFEGGGSGVGASGILASDVEAEPSSAFHARIARVTLNEFDGRAIHIDEGTVVCHISDVFAMNCLIDKAALAAKTGVLELNGTDHVIDGDIELTCGSTELSSVNAYACALVVRGAAHRISNVVAEISDVGIFIDAADVQMSDCRADLNMSHGWELAAGDGQLTNCWAYSNSQETTGLYSGFATFGGNFQLANCKATSQTAKKHRYGFLDTQSSDATKNRYTACLSFEHTDAPFKTEDSAGAAVTLGDMPRVSKTGATPSVGGITQVAMANVGATTVTNFLQGVGGQEITVWGEGQTTIQHNGTTIITATAANVGPIATNKCITLRRHAGVWVETGGTY